MSQIHRQDSRGGLMATNMARPLTYTRRVQEERRAKLRKLFPMLAERSTWPFELLVPVLTRLGPLRRYRLELS